MLIYEVADCWGDVRSQKQGLHPCGAVPASSIGSVIEIYIAISPGM